MCQSFLEALWIPDIFLINFWSSPSLPGNPLSGLDYDSLDLESIAYLSCCKFCCTVLHFSDISWNISNFGFCVDFMQELVPLWIYVHIIYLLMKGARFFEFETIPCTWPAIGIKMSCKMIGNILYCLSTTRQIKL